MRLLLSPSVPSRFPPRRWPFLKHFHAPGVIPARSQFPPFFAPPFRRARMRSVKRECVPELWMPSRERQTRTFQPARQGQDSRTEMMGNSFSPRLECARQGNPVALPIVSQNSLALWFSPPRGVYLRDLYSREVRNAGPGLRCAANLAPI